MKPEPNVSVELYRKVHPDLGASPPGVNWGYFEIQHPGGSTLRALAGTGDANKGIPWEHVSVSLPFRCPTWEEMCHVKDLFWGPDETVVQFHPRAKEYVKCHPYVLHLWKPTHFELELPPTIAIGPMKEGAGG